mmetsp:Transcript_63887/g.183520  ORF Transcript_63887/g.183520 Transcript_63887/m.183520 type:complete len:275 (+) Transcript_63887:456-1280(+)
MQKNIGLGRHLRCRRAGHQSHAPGRMQHRKEALRALRSRILQRVRLVADDDLPRISIGRLAEHLRLAAVRHVRHDEHELVRGRPIRRRHRDLYVAARQTREPPQRLVAPSRGQRRRDNDQRRAFAIEVLGDNSQCLGGLPQAHLVGQQHAAALRNCSADGDALVGHQALRQPKGLRHILRIILPAERRQRGDQPHRQRRPAQPHGAERPALHVGQHSVHQLVRPGVKLACLPVGVKISEIQALQLVPQLLSQVVAARRVSELRDLKPQAESRLR